MWLYLISLGLLFGCFLKFRSKLGPLDNTPTLGFIKTFGALASLIFFLWGFKSFEWYIPIIAILIVPGIVNYFSFKLDSSSNPNFLLMLKEQLGIFLGAIGCLISLI
jgi:hypothetical protein